MKKYVIAIFLFTSLSASIIAQDKNRTLSSKAAKDSLSLPKNDLKIDTAKVEVPSIYGWKITPRLGERVYLPMDTATFNFHQSLLVDGRDVAVGYLGNVGSPAQSKIFFNRPEASRFIFMDAMRYWRKNPEDHYFLNTKIPYSNVYYQSGGGGENTEQRLQTELSINLNKKLNVGFDFDYLYSRGFYNGLSNKQVNYDLNASYIGDKYKMHVFVANNNFTNIENGGITDDRYITEPNSDSIRISYKYSGKTKDIPVRFQAAQTWNKLRGRHFYMTHRYDLGDDTDIQKVDDTTTIRKRKLNYVPLASVILTSHYTDQQRRIETHDPAWNDIYAKKPYIDKNGEFVQYNISEKVKDISPRYKSDMNDFMSYYSFKNTLALAMNEGFRSWTKFGLTAFVEYDMRKYSIPQLITLGDGMLHSYPGIQEVHSENSLYLGGVLTKEKGKYLRYKATFAKDLFNDDMNLEGELTTKFSIANKNASIKAHAYLKRVKPSFFQNNFVSKYWSWTEDGLDGQKNSFKTTNRFYVGGEIIFPELSFLKLRASGGVENLTDYIYYNSLALPEQNSGSVRVYSLRLDQQFQAGIFHFDNQVVWQQSDNQSVIPLPKLSVYSNIYLRTKVAKVLTMQLGVDAHFHTKYFMPGYEPLTMQFYNQNVKEYGNFPIATAYLDLHLKYTRFFVMMYNVAQGTFNSESFSLYGYPVNPRVLKLGLSWRFNN